jgi:pyroglutamyl-peptidase
MRGTALITGFEPYGGRDINPSGELAAALDGARIGDLTVVGRTLPMVFAGLAERVAACLAETRPALVIALGLCPGEPAIRLERRAVNLAECGSPDNAGALGRGEPLEPGGAALTATLPLPAIAAALLADGIPARLSDSAGTFLCNATPTRCSAPSRATARPFPAASSICPICRGKWRRCWRTRALRRPMPSSPRWISPR